MQSNILKLIKCVLILFFYISTLIPLVHAQEVENIARFHSSKYGIYFRDIKKFGDYRYGVFEGGSGDLGKKDSMFYNGNFIEQDTSKGGNVWFFKMNEKNEVLFAGRFHDPTKTLRYLKRIFYHDGIVYFSLSSTGDLWYNGELIENRTESEDTFGPILVGVDEVTNKVVFVKGMDQKRFSGPEAIAFHGDRMYIGGTVYGFGTSPDGYEIVLPVVASGVKGGYLLVYDLTTGDIINSAVWGLGGYKSIQDMKVNSKGELFVLTNTGFGPYRIGLDTFVHTGSNSNNSFIHKYDKDGNLLDFYAFCLTPGYNNTLHQEMSILPDDRIAVFGATYGYIKTSDNDSLQMHQPLGIDLSVFNENLEMEWVDYYCYTPNNQQFNALYDSDMVTDDDGNIYITFSFFTPEEVESRKGEILSRGHYVAKYNSDGERINIKKFSSLGHKQLYIDLIKEDKVLVFYGSYNSDYVPFLDINRNYPDESYLFELNMDKLTSNIEDEVGENIEVTRIYPNPIEKDDILNISTQEDDEYKIYDVMGRILGSGYSSGGKISLIDHQLRTGVYIMKFGRNSKDSIRFIVQD